MSCSGWHSLLGTCEADQISAFGTRCDVVSLSAQISSYGRHGRWQEAVGVFADMARRNISPNIVSFNATMAACAASGQWSHALHLLGRIHRADLVPDTISYNVLITACERSDSWQRPLALLTEMRSSALDADSTSFNALLSVFRYTCEWMRALQLLNEMYALDVKVDNESIGAAVNACELGLHWWRAIELLWEFKHKALQSDGLSLASAQGACEEAGQHLFTARLVEALHRRAHYWCSGKSFSGLGISEYLQISNLLFGLGSSHTTDDYFLHKRLSAIQLENESSRTLCDIGPHLTSIFLRQYGITKAWQGRDLRGEVVGRLRQLRTSALPRLPRAMLLIACLAADLQGNQNGEWKLHLRTHFSGRSSKK